MLNIIDLYSLKLYNASNMEDKMKNKLYKHIEVFAKNLKIERTARNMTQKQMAESLGIKTQSYQAYERGLTLPSAENLVKLAIFLNVSIDELFELDK